MKTIYLFLIAIAFSAHADGVDLTITCDYKFMGVDFAKVTVFQHADGTWGPGAEVEAQGKKHKETLTVEEAAGDELLHAWLSKESAQNSVEMVIYRPRRSEGQSRVTNHRMPIGKDIWGDCTGLP